jgi:hypothetical protein
MNLPVTFRLIEVVARYRGRSTRNVKNPGRRPRPGLQSSLIV